MAPFAAYGHAILSLALWAVIIVALAAVSTRGRGPENRCDCGKPKRNYDDRWYRSERAFQNAIETSGPFIAATLAAILAGAPAFWVNLMASVFVISRIAVAYVHVATTNQPMRSALWAVGIFCIAFLVVAAAVAVL